MFRTARKQPSGRCVTISPSPGSTKVSKRWLIDLLAEVDST